MSQVAYDREQLAVVNAGGGAVLVSAGPGSGKTRALAGRVAHLRGLGVAGPRICLLTFTNRAASEMASRIGVAMSDVAAPSATTFHGLAAKLLRVHGRLLGIEPDFFIVDRSDALELMDVALGHTGGARVDPELALDLHSRCINRLVPLRDVVEERGLHLDVNALQDVFEVYFRAKAGLGALDFDDLLVYGARLLEDHADALQAAGTWFEHVLVDEFQDTNALQFRMVVALASPHGNVLAVGDPQQSIYGFRGADPANFERFAATFSPVRQLRLVRNYRSGAGIVRLSAALIRADVPPAQPSDALPDLVVCDDDVAEARFVAQRIEELHQDGVVFGDIAILFRLRSQAPALEEALAVAALPFRAGSPTPFFTTPHVRHVLALLKIAVEARDPQAMSRCLAALPSVGPATVKKVLAAVAGASDPLNELESGRVLRVFSPRAQPHFRRFVAFLVSVEAHGSARAAASAAVKLRSATSVGEPLPGELDDLREMVDFAGSFDDVRGFLASAALLEGATGYERRSPDSGACVTLSTIHQAKGREWPVVFVCGVGEGLLPFERSVAEGEVEEERRILYVASTRARQNLVLTCPQWRSQGGRSLRCGPSRFLEGVAAATGSDAMVNSWRVEGGR